MLTYAQTDVLTQVDLSLTISESDLEAAALDLDKLALDASLPLEKQRAAQATSAVVHECLLRLRVALTTVAPLMLGLPEAVAYYEDHPEKVPARDEADIPY